MSTTQVSIEDDFGNMHEYEITRHAGRDGFNLARKIMPAIQGGDIAGLAESLSIDVILELLKHTRRNGRLITPAEFDQAYQANYGELIEAVTEVLKANFGNVISRLQAGKLKVLEDI